MILMKMLKKLFTLLLALALTAQLVPAGLALCPHPEVLSPTPRQQICSNWAKEEISRAGALDLISHYVDTSDARGAINRKDYCRMAMQYLTAEQDQSYFWDLVAQTMAEHGEYGEIPNAFIDCDDAFDPTSCRVTLASVVGLVKGVGNGKFAPAKEITREEAAVMLTRAYTVIGGELPAASLSYADAASVSDWAEESVAAVTALGVMQGVGDNRFDPAGTYTAEQCIATFLRLYEKAPVSRPNGNVKQFFNGDDVLGCLSTLDAAQNNAFAVYQTVKGPAATFVQTAITGVMGGTSSLLLVYSDGTTQSIEPQVCSAPRSVGDLDNATVIKDVQFSADGKTLTFTIPLENDTVTYASGDPVVLHEKGNYLCTVDVATGDCTTTSPDGSVSRSSAALEKAVADYLANAQASACKALYTRDHAVLVTTITGTPHGDFIGLQVISADKTLRSLPLPTTSGIGGCFRAPDTMVLSQDGRTLTYTYRFDEPVTFDTNVLTEAGLHTYVADLATGETAHTVTK